MTVVVLLCLVGGVLLSMFPKTGAVILLTTAALVAARSVSETGVTEVAEDVPNSVYVSEESQEYSSQKWLPHVS